MRGGKKMMIKQEKPIVSNLVYDNVTGKIVLRRMCFDSDKKEYYRCDPQKLKEEIARNKVVMRKVTDQNPNNLQVVVTTELPENPSTETGNCYRVDPQTKRLVRKSKISLTADKTELEGDGQDITVIHLRVLIDNNAVDTTYNGTIKVATSRGKLSTKGGLVEVKKGVGQLTLTSVNETVDRVHLVATCQEGRCVRGSLDLQFL
jgi:hypothetical protein